MSGRTSTSGWGKPAAGLLLAVTVAAATLAGCSQSSPPAPSTSSSPGPTPTLSAEAGFVDMTGWKLTLPSAGKDGDAAILEPAKLSPPWLTQDAGGGLTFWAPVTGATTANSDHPRTELDSLHNFQVGRGRHALLASVSVTQVPTKKQDVIIGQLHGADDISSVAFVMLHYTGGSIKVVVKKSEDGSDATTYPLLTGVPLSVRFDYSIRDNGNGSLTLGARYGDKVASVDVRIPDDFKDATVRFQAGAYQLGKATKQAALDDGARVTFFGLSEGGAAATASDGAPTSPSATA
jgi:hypothetical protein